jgi:ABC-2 type transport system permease protein
LFPLSHSLQALTWPARVGIHFFRGRLIFLYNHHWPETAGNWVFLTTLVLAAPIFEEWLFRGLLYRSLRRSWGLVTSVAISALLFTAIHPMASSVAVLGLGVATAVVLERTGRLWSSMLVHIGDNTFIVALWNIPL